MAFSNNGRIRVNVTGARGALGIDLQGTPTPGQYLVKGAGGGRSFSAITPATSIANAVPLTDLASGTGTNLVGYGGESLTQRLQREVLVTDTRFAGGAKLDGTTNDSPAIQAAVNSLPNGGTVRFPPGLKAKLNTTITDNGVPINFVLEGVGVIAPANGAAFKLTANSSSITGQGSFSKTIIECNDATGNPTLPVISVTVSSGSVTAVTMSNPGSNLRSTLVCRVRGSSTANDAVISLKVNPTTGQCVAATLLSGGSGYANSDAVVITIEGGGVPVVWCAGPQAVRLKGFGMDLKGKTYGAGVFLEGGWYQYYEDVGVVFGTIGAKGYGLIADSRDGPIGTGSYAATYVNTFTNVRAGRAAFIGYDDKTPTTHLVNTLECTYLHLHLCRDFLFTNAVVQGSEDCLIDASFCDSTTFVGGDCEGAPAFILRSRGDCANTRFYNMRRDATSGAGDYVGEPGPGSLFDFANNANPKFPLRVGSLSAGEAWRNVGFKAVHRVGITFDGNVLAMASNVRPTSLSEGVLDDPNAAGTAIFLSTSGQFIVRYATPGTGSRPLIELAVFDGGGMALRNLPTTAPAAGSGRLWNDAGTVKISV